MCRRCLESGEKMNLASLKKISDYQYMIEPHGKMKVPVRIFADESLLKAMDEKVYEQATNVAALPGIVKSAWVMPDAHWGYGFPIGGVAAFDPDNGGVISAGGVGFDISCGVRCVASDIDAEELKKRRKEVADILARKIPAGVGSTGKIRLTDRQMEEMLTSGAEWAVNFGCGSKDHLRFLEENGKMAKANPDYVSEHAKQRQIKQVGTLGSGNHYLEVQEVVEIYDKKIAEAFNLEKGKVVMSIHCGSRGLGHQIGTDFLKQMVHEAQNHGIELPDRELACAPIDSKVGQKYLGAMYAGINCAFANRQVLMHLLFESFKTMFPGSDLKILYDVSHNTCKEEEHEINGKKKKLFIHRKGATRAYGPGYKDLPAEYKQVGQPVVIGGTMGTFSYILAGTAESEKQAMSSSCHGAGRAMSRSQATKRYQGKEVVNTLASQGVVVKSPSYKGVAEEAPNAYKNVIDVVKSAHNAGLSVKVAKLKPIVCVKG